MVMLKLELHYRSPIVVKVEVGLHYGCSRSDQMVSRGDEASE